MKSLFSILFFLSICPFASLAQGKANSRPADFPTPPKTSKSLFFIQRNLNVNTIAYDANLGADGKFDRSNPIDAHWLRYTSDGHRRELSWLENNFAYGYSAKSDGNGGYWVELTAYDDRKIHLEKTSDGKPIATIQINGKQCQLEFLWVYADTESKWPKVYHVDIHGKELATGKKQVERIVND